MTSRQAAPETGSEYPVRRREQPFSGRIFDLVVDMVEMPEGRVVHRDYLVHPGAVGVVAIDDEYRILLIQQYRHAVGTRMWELPAGLVDKPGEDLRVAVARELAEEVGLRADHWELLVDVHTTPGCSNEVFRMYLARDLHPADGRDQYRRHDEEAEIVAEFVPLDEAVGMVLSGEITNACCMIGVLAAARIRDNGRPTPRSLDEPLPRRPLPPVRP